MPELLWDASALTKRYTPELGSDAVDACFPWAVSRRMISTYIVFAETCAVLRRRFNRGDIDLAVLTAARSSIRDEVLLDPSFCLLTIENDDILAGIELTDRYNLNSTDAAILAAYLDYSRAQPTGAPNCVLVAADQRLLNAAAAEGLQVLNPESLPAADVTSLLGSM